MKVFEVQETFGFDSLKLTEREEPRPGPGQVLLCMKAFSLNFRDQMMIKGTYNPKIRLPFVPLSDGVGEVVELGNGVTHAKKGDRVAGTFFQNWAAGELTEANARSALGGGGVGVLAEYVVLDEKGIVHVPEHLTDEEAATLPCAGLTAWNALFEAGAVRPGESVLIQGTGGVSIFALQFARLAGARVIATSSNDRKLERVRALGASDGINYRSTPDWEESVRQLSGGAGVDHVVEVGGAGTLAKSLRAIRIGGQISLIGVLATGAREVNPLPILMKSVRVRGIFVGSREMFEAMNRAIRLQQLRPIVDRTFGFAETKEALRYMESGAHFGKVCIRM
jgi:NADPH:quinone reductase-like Zn-dependent oxidoreductase